MGFSLDSFHFKHPLYSGAIQGDVMWGGAQTGYHDPQDESRGDPRVGSGAVHIPTHAPERPTTPRRLSSSGEYNAKLAASSLLSLR